MDVQSRKTALLREFENVIAPARQRLAAQLPQLWAQTYGYLSQHPPAAALAKAGSKRPSASNAVGAEAKRPRCAEVERRFEPLYSKCQKMVKNLFNINSSVWFRKPVDPIRDGCPNYLHFVKRPMDLGTIRTKLQTKAYRSPLEVKEDVDLVWHNCALYNQEGQPARIDGERCKAAFERAWRDSSIEAAVQQILEEADNLATAQATQPAQAGPAAQAAPATAPLHDRIHNLNTQLGQAVAQLPRASQDGGPPGDMTFAEKRQLSKRLAAGLSAEQYQAVLDVVVHDPRVAMSAGGEVEVAIDDLRPETLWRLQEVLDPPPAKQVPQSRPQPPLRQADHEGTAERRMASASNQVAKRQNGIARVHSSGGSESDSGEHSPNEVKGSTLDNPNHGTTFVRDARHTVDESATNPKEPSQFVKDRAARKADVNINTANWDSLPSAPSAEVGALDVQPEGDDVWKSFQSIAEQKQNREEQQRREAEQAQRQRREERERQKREEEERQKKLREAEERQQAEVQRRRQEQMQRELDEIKAKAGTANLTQQGDVAMMASMSAFGADSGGLAAVGLELAGDADDLMFDDDI